MEKQFFLYTSKKNTEVNNKSFATQPKKEKINLYLFYGEGCPHCKHLAAFLENMEAEYKEMFTLYTYEIWYNKENKELLEKVSTYTNRKGTSVPYLLIGHQVFVGFADNKKESIKKAIQEEYEKEERIDYIEKIQKK